MIFLNYRRFIIYHVLMRCLHIKQGGEEAKVKVEAAAKGNGYKYLSLFLMMLGIVFYWAGGNAEKYGMFIQLGGIVFLSAGVYIYLRLVIVSYIYELGKNELKIYQKSGRRVRLDVVLPYESVIKCEILKEKPKGVKLYNFSPNFSNREFIGIFAEDGFCYKLERQEEFYKRLFKKLKPGS